MLRVELCHAKPGMTLALPVRHPRTPERILLKGNFTLTDNELVSLTQLGVGFVWVRYPSLDFLSKMIGSELLAKQAVLFNHVTSTFEKLQTQSNAKLPYDLYCRSVSDLISELLSNPQAGVFLDDLVQTGGDLLMRHSSAVTYLSLLMGLKLEDYLIRQRRHIDPSRAKDVVNLGVGAMLHDMGVTLLPKEFRQAYEASGDDSAQPWREHPSLGYAMVRGRVEPSAATVVLNHHQRWDGSGYAGAAVPVLENHRIHIFARIVGLADEFDRRRNPPAAPPRPAVLVLRELLEPAAQGQFDPAVLRALFTVVPPYPPGSIVHLSDGRWAVCIDHSPTDPCRPVVQVIPHPESLDESDKAGEVIPLSKTDGRLCVRRFEGQDVSAWNFPAPPLLRRAAGQEVWA